MLSVRNVGYLIDSSFVPDISRALAPNHLGAGNGTIIRSHLAGEDKGRRAKQQEGPPVGLDSEATDGLVRAGVRADPGEGVLNVIRAVLNLGLVHYIPQRLNLERADVGMLGSRLNPLLACRGGAVAFRAALNPDGQLCVTAAAVAHLVLCLLVRLEGLGVLDVDLAADVSSDAYVLGLDIDLEILVVGRVGDVGPGSLAAG